MDEYTDALQSGKSKCRGRFTLACRWTCMVGEEFMVAVKKSEIMFTRVKLPGPLSKCWQTQVHQKGP